MTEYKPDMTSPVGLRALAGYGGELWAYVDWISEAADAWEADRRRLAWLREQWVEACIASWVEDGWPTKTEQNRIRKTAAAEEAEAFPDP